MTPKDSKDKPAIVSYYEGIEAVKRGDKKGTIESLDELLVKSTTSRVSGGKDLEYLEAIKQGLDDCYILEIDIDDFKKNVNDKYGHDYGNLVLKHLYWYLDISLRKKGHVIHKHGEEFRVLLFDDSLEDTKKVADELRISFQKYTQSHPEFEEPITFSVGLSYYNKEKGTLEDAFKQADKALNEAKETGRNKIVVYKHK